MAGRIEASGTGIANCPQNWWELWGGALYPGAGSVSINHCSLQNSKLTSGGVNIDNENVGSS